MLSYGCVRGDSLMPAVLAARPQRFLVVDVSMKEIEVVKTEFGNAAQYSVMDGHALAFDGVRGTVILFGGYAIFAQLRRLWATQRAYRLAMEAEA